MSLTEAMFPPESNWIPPTSFPRLTGAKLIGLDCETKDPNLLTQGPGALRKDGYVVGISLATEDAKWYFPIAHEGGGNLDKEKVVNWLQDVLSTDIPKVGANLLYDLEWLKADLGIQVSGPFYDVQVAEPLLDEDRKGGYALQKLSESYLGKGKEETGLEDAAKAYGIDPKGGLWRLHSRYVGPYAEEDAQLPIQIFKLQEKQLRKENLWDLFELESKLIPCLLAMRFLGVRVDIEKAYEVSKEIMHREKSLTDELRINPWSTKDLVRIFTKEKMPIVYTTSGNPSFTRQYLEHLGHPISDKIVEYRVLSKNRRDFIDGLILKQNIEGRLHAQFHQLRNDRFGTRSGRFSSSNPNLQQIPARHPYWGAVIRGLFLPDKETQWGKFDYSQQEPRLTVHYGEKCNLKGASEAGDKYRHDSRTDFHQLIAKLTGLERRQAKTINLGLAYGMGKYKLAEEMGVTLEEAEPILQKYHSNAPFIRQLSNKCSDRSMVAGEIITILGRKRRLSQGNHHKALNALIQGSAADMTKRAMLQCYEKGLIPHLQVHDELCFSIKDPETAKLIKSIMENAVKLTVPVVVDCDLGNNWAMS
jgi:DNA polymerase I-like protein with 3'-5' exonuclease and polymerase domains